jgi:hypothetical protein
VIEKEVGFGAGSGSIKQRYGSWYPDPDPHQNVTDPPHWNPGQRKSYEEKGGKSPGSYCRILIVKLAPSSSGTPVSR